MPTLTNNHHANLFLPDGTAIRRGGPGVSLPAEKWAGEIMNPVVAAWVASGWIRVSGEQPAPEPEPAAAETASDDPRDPLRDEARALGIDINMRWGEARLRTEIDKARAA
jgi:hypothetical protein